MPKIYRVMKRDGDFPRIGPTSNSLDVRISRDIEPDENDLVKPQGKGMSVSPSMRSIPSILVPRRLCRDRPDLSKAASGSDNQFVWSMGVGPFVAAKVERGLNLRPDQPAGAKHGVVEPAEIMHIDSYREALHATREQWSIDEN